MRSIRGSCNPASEGFWVLDFNVIMAGPYCTRWLADMDFLVLKYLCLGGI